MDLPLHAFTWHDPAIMFRVSQSVNESTDSANHRLCYIPTNRPAAG